MKKNLVEIYDNFMPTEDFVHLAKSTMYNFQYIPMEKTAFESEGDGSLSNLGEPLNPDQPIHESMFQAVPFHRLPSGQIETSAYYNLYPQNFDPLMEALNISKLWQLRVNITTGQSENYVGSYHIDYELPYFLENTKTAILYLNTNNGGTKFEETGQLVQSKANRLVKFPQGTKHAGVWCTDAKLRVVMNICFEEKDDDKSSN